MRSTLLVAALALVAAGHPTAARAQTRPSPAPPAAALAPAPALVVLVVVDQLRPDYFDRFGHQLTGGFAWFRRAGVFYPHGRQDHAITETAPGHSTILSGRPPSSTGIVTNKRGVQDLSAPLVAGGDPGASPRRFRGTALYDWMLAADPEARVLAVSRKDRGAILPVGRARGEVYWYSSTGGLFTTSRYYHDSLPGWVQAFNARRGPERLAGTSWTTLLPAEAYPEPDSMAYERGGKDFTFPHRLPAEGPEAARQMRHYPWMDSLTLDLALDGVTQLDLGRRDRPDLLTVSLSTLDDIGHDFGPDSREVHDQFLRQDHWLGWFIDSLAVLRPQQRTVFVLTSDHGIQPFPEYSWSRGRPGGRVWLGDLAKQVGDSLQRRYAVDFEFDFDYGGLLTADTDALKARGVDVAALTETMAAQARTVPGVARVFTPATLAAARAGDEPARLWRRMLPADLTWILALVTEPGYTIQGTEGWVHHGSSHLLDVEVPIAFVVPGLPRRTVPDVIRTTDIGPTLAALLGVAPTEVVDGKPLPAVVGRQ